MGSTLYDSHNEITTITKITECYAELHDRKQISNKHGRQQATATQTTTNATPSLGYCLLLCMLPMRQKGIITLWQAKVYVKSILYIFMISIKNIVHRSMSFCPSVCLSICLSVCPYVSLSVCLLVCLSVCLYSYINLDLRDYNC